MSGVPSSERSVRANRQRECGDLMAALEECHSKGILARMSGRCNFEAARVSECFHEERMARTKEHVNQRQAAAGAAMKDINAYRQEQAAAHEAMKLRKARLQAEETQSASQP